MNGTRFAFIDQSWLIVIANHEKEYRLKRMIFFEG